MYGMTRQKPTYIYFVKPIGFDGPIKIGYSRKPSNRLLVLAAWSPFPLEIIGTAPGGSEEENFLHRKFATSHTHREWFQSSPKLRQVIELILAGHDVKSACADILDEKPIKNQKKRLVTPERQRFIDYGKRIRKALMAEGMSNKIGSRYAPLDVQNIMESWRGDYASRAPIEPTDAEIARLDEFLSDPMRHAVLIPYGLHRESKMTLDEARVFYAENPLDDASPRLLGVIGQDRGQDLLPPFQSQPIGAF